MTGLAQPMGMMGAPKAAKAAVTMSMVVPTGS